MSKTHNNVLFFTYEEMQKDLPSIIKKVKRFLGKDCEYTEKEMSDLLQHLSFNKMKDNSSVNKQDTVEVRSTNFY